MFKSAATRLILWYVQVECANVVVGLTAGASRQSHKGQCGSLWFSGARQKSYALNHTQKTGHYCSQSGWITISKPDRQENRMIGTLWWQLLLKEDDRPISTKETGRIQKRVCHLCRYSRPTDYRKNTFTVSFSLNVCRI